MFNSIREYLKYRGLNKNRTKLGLFLSNFGGVDKDMVGRQIAEGLQHYIFEYGEDKVLKVPKLDLPNLIYGMLNPKDVESDWKLINQYFRKYIVETRVYASKDNELYCVIQKKIRNKLNINSHNIDLVLKQFNDIYLRNKKLEFLTGYSLDLWGKSGILRSIRKSIVKSNIFIEMTNLIIEQDELKNYRIKIIDTNLFKVEISFGYLVRIFTDKIIYMLSDFVLKRAKFISRDFNA